MSIQSKEVNSMHIQCTHSCVFSPKIYDSDSKEINIRKTHNDEKNERRINSRYKISKQFGSWQWVGEW